MKPNYSDWSLLVGEKEEKEWNDRKYRFRIGTDHQEEMRVIDSIDTNTPIGHMLEESVNDIFLRSICFLSYYQVNPTFDNNDGLGDEFFWFPLDTLNDKRYKQLTNRIKNSEYVDGRSENKNNESDEKSMLPDFPVMSTIGGPIIEAATEESYVQQANRQSIEQRRKTLQGQIKNKQEEVVNEVEEWLEEGITNSQYSNNLSEFSFRVGTLPAHILLRLIKEERQRIENIDTVLSNIGVEQDEDFDPSPQSYLNRLNTLTENHPALQMPAIEAFCLDTNDRDCDYHVTKTRGLDVSELDDCEYCGSELFRIFRTGIDSTVKTAWMQGLLPELIVARLLQQADWTDQVLPHRLVQMEKNGELTTSVEVDVIVHTNCDKIIFVEVTSQTDALSRLGKKRKKFEDAGIEYDGVVQIAPYDNQGLIPFDDDVVSVPGWMIRGLEKDEFKQDLFNQVSSL